MTRLNAAAKRGATWLTLQSVGIRGAQIISQLILAKLLAAEIFGAVALAVVVTTVAQTVVNFGLDDFLVQRGRRLGLWQRRAAGVAALGSVSVTLALLMLAPVIARAYRAPVLWPVLSIMLLSLPFQSLSAIGMASARSDMRFKAIAVIGFGEAALIQLLSVTLAAFHLQALALALPIPLVALAKWFGLRSIGLMPTVRLPKRRDIRFLISKPSFILGHRLLISVTGQLDVAILGLFATRSEIGYYAFAFKLAVQPISFLAGNIYSVAFPLLRSLNADPQRQLQLAGVAARVISAGVILASLAQMMVAPTLLNALFGSKWNHSVPLIQILSLALSLDSVSWIVGALMVARGEFRRLFLFTCRFFILFVGLVMLGAAGFKAIGVSAALLVYYSIVGPLLYWRFYGGGMAALLKTLNTYFRAPILGLACFSGPWFIMTKFGSHRLVDAVIATSVATVLYIPVIIITDPPMREMFLARLLPLKFASGRTR